MPDRPIASGMEWCAVAGNSSNAPAPRRRREVEKREKRQELQLEKILAHLFCSTGLAAALVQSFTPATTSQFGQRRRRSPSHLVSRREESEAQVSGQGVEFRDGDVALQCLLHLST